MHIVFTIANNSSVPYFNWFAEKAAEQKEHKFTFIALHSEKPQMIEDVGKYGWNCYWVRFNNKHRKSGMLKAFFKLLVLLKKLNPDVVHTHLFDDSVPTLFAAKILRIKKRVITKQDTTFHYYYAPKWVWFDKFNNKNATDIVPVSHEAKQFIIDKEKVDTKKITVIHHGIPASVFTNQSEEHRKFLITKYQLTNKIVIGTVARLIEWKGYRYIIEAAKLVIDKYPNAVFLFVGEGEQKQELIEIAKQFNVLENIIFTGWIERKYIPAFYSILDVYVHAASYEPFGFVIPEAMMNKAPVVSTPTGAALDAIKHKENGYLVEYKNAKSLANGIIYTIKNGADFKENGQLTALKMYDFEVMYNNYIKFYLNK